MSVSGIAASGMAAAMARVTASASNTANANVLGPVPVSGPPIQLLGGPQTDEPGIQLLGGPAVESASVYQPVRVDQSENAGGGTTTSYRPQTPAYTLRYAPDLPFADNAGMVAAPAVDLGQEAVERLTANLAYQANMRVLGQADDQERMTIALLG